MVAIQNCLGRPFDSRKMLLRNSFSFDGRELEAMFSIRSPSLDDDRDQVINQRTNESDNYSPKLGIGVAPELGNERRYQAALKLQKVYKSFRTRRQLADCAVLVEQKWWKVLDFAELKRSSISFFDIEKPESAISRWSRARTRAAKVGKGISKDEKARKLALQHWLEAIDPRHRYGHNLQYYYVEWLHCDSRQPFFYWLDIGEGRGANLDICPRSKLQVQCIKYLGPKEREAYEVVVENGKFTYKQTGKVLDTTEAPKGSKWIFVLSTAKSLYVGQKHKGTFQHSSFLAGGATLSAGRLVVEDGILKAVWPHSGHYLPTEENFQAFMSFLMENNVDLTHVKKHSSEEEEGIISKKEWDTVDAESQSLAGLGTSFGEGEEMENSGEQYTDAVEDSNLDVSRLSRGLRSKIKKLEIPSREDVLEAFKAEQPPDACSSPTDDVSSEDGYETAEDSLLSEDDFTFPKLCLFGEEEEEEFQTPIPEEAILRRINSHRRTKSYQLGAQLSCKWTTGAGPRIGCLRDYPSRLQAQALEQTNLSPRCDRSCGASPRIVSSLSPRVVLPTGFRLRRSPLASEPVSPSPGHLINQT